MYISNNIGNNWYWFSRTGTKQDGLPTAGRMFPMRKSRELYLNFIQKRKWCRDIKFQRLLHKYVKNLQRGTQFVYVWFFPYYECQWRGRKRHIH